MAISRENFIFRKCCQKPSDGISRNKLQSHIMSKLQLWIFLLFLQFSAFEAASDQIYHNQIAVNVLGGDAVVEKVARRSGMTSLGRIGDLQDLYLLESHLISKR